MSGLNKVLPFTCIKLHFEGEIFTPVLVGNDWQLQSAAHLLVGSRGNPYQFKTEQNANVWIDSNLIKASKSQLTAQTYIDRLTVINSVSPHDYLAQEIAIVQARNAGEWGVYFNDEFFGDWDAYIKGDTGAQGEQGAQGVKGDTGAAGAQGAQGLQGVQGLKGDKGEAGAAGAQGLQGVQGLKGDTGAAGAQGVQGVKGDKGDAGLLNSFELTLNDNAVAEYVSAAHGLSSVKSVIVGMRCLIANNGYAVGDEFVGGGNTGSIWAVISGGNLSISKSTNKATTIPKAGGAPVTTTAGRWLYFARVYG